MPRSIFRSRSPTASRWHFSSKELDSRNDDNLNRRSCFYPSYIIDFMKTRYRSSDYFGQQWDGHFFCVEVRNRLNQSPRSVPGGAWDSSHGPKCLTSPGSSMQLIKEEGIDMAYKLEGSLLEVCNCEVLCPCWIGVDPDNGTCDSALAHHFEKGEIDGVDVSGLTLGFIVHIPGNVLKGNWRAVVHIDQRATKEQEQALLSVYTGKQGGPIADLVQLIGEVVAV